MQRWRTLYLSIYLYIYTRNSLYSLLTNIVQSLWTFLFGFSLKVFKTRLLGRGYHTLVRNVLFNSLINVRSHRPLPWDPTSSLAYCLVFGCDTSCNNLSPLLADIVIFELFVSGFSSSFLKHICQREVFTSCKKCFIPFSNQCGISQSPPSWWTQRHQCRISQSTSLEDQYSRFVGTNVGSNNPPPWVGPASPV